MRRGFKVREGERVVIVEDVVTTGKSTREAAEVVKTHGGIVYGFASILDRSGKKNPFDASYESLLQLNLETYQPEECPLCKAGVLLDAPGSRFSAK
jgi:orotate phosphoribosyltransferase